MYMYMYHVNTLPLLDVSYCCYTYVFVVVVCDPKVVVWLISGYKYSTITYILQMCGCLCVCGCGGGGCLCVFVVGGGLIVLRICVMMCVYSTCISSTLLISELYRAVYCNHRNITSLLTRVCGLA